MYPSVQSDTAYKILDKEGDRRYELSNHLGNILAVISDRKLGVANGNAPNYTSFEAITISATDYFPFGMSMPGRSWTSPNTEGYRYSFNGKEDDTEWAKQDFGARIYDPRLGRWLSIDPKSYNFPNNSPYCFALNNPIVLVDKDGKIPIIPIILKMASGAAADYLMQVGMNYYFNSETRGSLEKSMEKVDMWQVSRSALEGAIPWKTPGGKLGKAAATATFDVIQQYGKAVINGQDYDSGDAIKDFMTGFIGDLAGGSIGDLVDKYGSKSIGMGLSKLGFDDKKIEDILTGAGTTWKGPVDYSDLDVTDKMAKTRGVGKDFTTNQKDAIKANNKKANNGHMRSDMDGTFLNKGKAGGNDPLSAEVDHKVAKKGTPQGSNKHSNAQVLSKEQNGKKSNN